MEDVLWHIPASFFFFTSHFALPSPSLPPWPPSHTDMNEMLKQAGTTASESKHARSHWICFHAKDGSANVKLPEPRTCIQSERGDAESPRLQALYSAAFMDVFVFNQQRQFRCHHMTSRHLRCGGKLRGGKRRKWNFSLSKSSHLESVHGRSPGVFTCYCSSHRQEQQNQHASS